MEERRKNPLTVTGLFTVAAFLLLFLFSPIAFSDSFFCVIAILIGTVSTVWLAKCSFPLSLLPLISVLPALLLHRNDLTLLTLGLVLLPVVLGYSVALILKCSDNLSYAIGFGGALTGLFTFLFILFCAYLKTGNLSTDSVKALFPSFFSGLSSVLRNYFQIEINRTVYPLLQGDTLEAYINTLLFTFPGIIIGGYAVLSRLAYYVYTLLCRLFEKDVTLQERFLLPHFESAVFFIIGSLGLVLSQNNDVLWFTFVNFTAGLAPIFFFFGIQNTFVPFRDDTMAPVGCFRPLILTLTLLSDFTDFLILAVFLGVFDTVKFFIIQKKNGKG